MVGAPVPDPKPSVTLAHGQTRQDPHSAAARHQPRLRRQILCVAVDLHRRRPVARLAQDALLGFPQSLVRLAARRVRRGGGAVRSGDLPGDDAGDLRRHPARPRMELPALDAARRRAAVGAAAAARLCALDARLRACPLFRAHLAADSAHRAAPGGGEPGGAAERVFRPERRLHRGADDRRAHARAPAAAARRRLRRHPHAQAASGHSDPYRLARRRPLACNLLGRRR